MEQEKMEQTTEEKTTYYERNKNKIKEYYQTNKEAIKIKNDKKKQEKQEYFKQYYKENRDKILKRSRENPRQPKRIICECGCYIDDTHRSRHLKTKKHKERMELIERRDETEVVSNNQLNINQLRQKHFKW